VLDKDHTAVKTPSQSVKMTQDLGSQACLLGKVLQR
jgi:hypothetical protein